MLCILGGHPLATVRDQPGAGGAERMADRERAAPGVDPIELDGPHRGVPPEPLGAPVGIIEQLEHCEHLRRKRFVQLHDLDIRKLETG